MTNTPSTTATTTTLLHPEEVEQLKKLYTFREPSAVLQFLAKYPFLVPILLEAHKPTRKYFPDSPLFLEVVTDPEAVSRDENMLWVFIDRTEDLDLEAAIDTLEQLDDDWWIDAEKRAQGKIFIGFD